MLFDSHVKSAANSAVRTRLNCKCESVSNVPTEQCHQLKGCTEALYTPRKLPPDSRRVILDQISAVTDMPTAQPTISTLRYC
jgi:hypothetical protein